ncbi:hypothetical protein [Citrobacter braakii]|uniref:hypothetical protein n=1 Tax=Citrobacter braakii TaxID=57706 RepID=UPI0040395A01
MSEKKKSITVMLDSEITAHLMIAQELTIEKMKAGGVFGKAAVPSLGFIARQALRTALKIPDSNHDNPYKN